MNEIKQNFERLRSLREGVSHNVLPFRQKSAVHAQVVDLNAALAKKAEVAEVLVQRTIKTPQKLLNGNSFLFSLRIVLALQIIYVASILMMSGNAVAFVIGMIVQGAMYVHLVELQHSVLHLHAFGSPKWNRPIGFLLGLPMLISFSDFQYRHLRHHKYLGTKLNSETFSYQHDELNSVGGFIKAMLDYSRLHTIATRIVKAYMHKPISDGLNPLMEARIIQEYQWFGMALGFAILICMLTHSIWPLILWLVPFSAAEPVHFLLELPEHIGLKAHSNPNVFENTRSWGGSWFARWYSHNTNYHVAHHFNQLVPMHNLPKLQLILEEHIPQRSRSKSYPDFYIEVITGKIKASDGD